VGDASGKGAAYKAIEMAARGPGTGAWARQSEEGRVTSDEGVHDTPRPAGRPDRSGKGALGEGSPGYREVWRLG
jgi:hypothetical protein